MSGGLLIAFSTVAQAHVANVVADFNGDGIADLAIGAPSADGRGDVSIFYGRPGGFSTTTVTTPDVIIRGRARGEEYGFALAAADFDGDGRSELVVGAPSWSKGRGRIEVLRHWAPGDDDVMIFGPIFYTDGLPGIHQNTDNMPDQAEPDDWFGRALAIGDFDGNGHPDLAVGVQAEDLDGVVNAGAVHVIYSTHDGLSIDGSDFWSQRGGGILDEPEANDQFGSALAAGDINGDGFDDLAVGVSLEDVTFVDQGAVNVILGTAAGLSSSGDHFLTIGTDQRFRDGQLGFAVAIGDINGDGFADLAIGAPIGLSGVGFVAVTYGGPGGAGALFVHTQTADPAEAGDLLGYSLAVADFNGDGFADVAAGAPGEDLNGLVNAGAVSVFYGQTGFALNRQEIWHQNSPGVENEIEASDFFGLSLTAGDYNSDGYADLAIGVPWEDWGGFADLGVTNVITGLPTGLTGGADSLMVPETRATGIHFGASVR